MNESGPIRKTYKDRETESGFADFTRITSNVWRATAGSKYWLVKIAKNNDSASIQLLRREYEISCNFHHPFIVTVNSFEEETAKGPAIVMEYIAGRTLREFISEKPSLSKRRKVLGQLLDAIEYIHRNGVLHNDIKPENILITEIGDDVKLIDFGLSENDAGYLEKRLGGTRGSSAPEVLSGDLSSSSTAAADIYSIGGIIELLFPRRYSVIVHKCHRDNPHKRYQDIASLRTAILRRNVVPWILISVLAILSLLLVSILPVLIFEREQQHQQAMLKERINDIQKDMYVFYKEAADSITDRNLVPYQEFGILARATFVNRTIEYKSGLEQEMLLVCDSIYARMVGELSKMIISIPPIGDLSSEENQWYLNLFLKNKPYSPYIRKQDK